eukprot:13033200-Heterocapsa_arctica.AAC.1
MSLDKIALVLRDPYPEGSHSRRSAGRDDHGGRGKFGRMSYMVEHLNTDKNDADWGMLTYQELERKLECKAESPLI